MIKNIIDKLENLIFPRSLYCIVCGNIVDSSRTYSICDHCMKKLRWNYEGLKDYNGIDGSYAISYDIYSKAIIFSLKYNGRRELAYFIGEILADKARQIHLEGDIIVPVPIHKKKERERGFNQAYLMSKYFGKFYSLDVLEDGLVRTRYTKAMRALSKEERKLNIKDAIKVNSRVASRLEGKNIILVDDFFTTGSTALACKEALIKAGANSVVFLAFASH